MLLSALAEMLEFKMLLTKLGIKLYYTDTDSIFIDKDLPQHLIGNELGLMKDELKGGLTKKAYFLGIKNMVILIIIKPSPARFFKNISKLNINIKNNLEISIKFHTRKFLFNNKY